MTFWLACAGQQNLQWTLEPKRDRSWLHLILLKNSIEFLILKAWRWGVLPFLWEEHHWNGWFSRTGEWFEEKCPHGIILRRYLTQQPLEEGESNGLASIFNPVFWVFSRRFNYNGNKEQINRAKVILNVDIGLKEPKFLKDTSSLLVIASGVIRELWKLDCARIGLQMKPCLASSLTSNFLQFSNTSFTFIESSYSEPYRFS